MQDEEFYKYSGITKEEYDKIEEEIIEGYATEERQKEEVLESIKSKFGKIIYEDVLYELKESGTTGSYEVKTLSKEKKSRLEKGCTDAKLGVYVNQTTNGGYTGDYFSGYVYIRLKGNKFFYFDYSM